MDMYLSSLEWVFDKLEAWMGRASKREKEAVDLFLDALNMTQKYLGSLERDITTANRESEQALSDAWTMAAKAVRVHDHDLYQRCLAKACHWSGSSQFRKTEIANINISIEKMINIAIQKSNA